MGISWSASPWQTAGTQAAAARPYLFFPEPPAPPPLGHLVPLALPTSCLSVPFMVSLCILVSVSDSALSTPAPEVSPVLPPSLPSYGLLNGSSGGSCSDGKIHVHTDVVSIPMGLMGQP